MKNRANHFETAPEAMKILMQQEAYLREQFCAVNALSTSLWELVKLRVSQINQCAFCVDMHSKDAIASGETLERIVGLTAWRDMPVYSKVERIALQWAELLTVGEATEDETYQEAVEVFGELGIVVLTLAVNAINSWNRVAKTFKPEVGRYQP